MYTALYVKSMNCIRERFHTIECDFANTLIALEECATVVKMVVLSLSPSPVLLFDWKNLLFTV